MSSTQYLSGTATRLTINQDLPPQEQIEDVKNLVGFPISGWCNRLEDGYWDIRWRSWDRDHEPNKQEVRYTDGSWWLIKYTSYNEGYINQATKISPVKLAFTFVFYDGGTCFDNELEEAAQKAQ